MVQTTLFTPKPSGGPPFMVANPDCWPRADPPQRARWKTRCGVSRLWL